MGFPRKQESPESIDDLVPMDKLQALQLAHVGVEILVLQNCLHKLEVVHRWKINRWSMVQFFEALEDSRLTDHRTLLMIAGPDISLPGAVLVGDCC